MKRGKNQNRSQSTLKDSSHVQESQDVPLPSLDVLKVNIKSLRFANDDRRPHTISASFFDQLLFSETITPIGLNDVEYDEGPYYHFIAGGTMSFDPSDYAKMCLFADIPLIVRLQPPGDELGVELGDELGDTPMPMPPMSCCNVDILPLFQGKTKMCILKRMEPMIEPISLEIQSWENLPLVRMELRVTRDPANQAHHEILDAANILRATVIGAYNIIMPYNYTFEYIVATKMGLSNRVSNGESSEYGVYKYTHSTPCFKKNPINGFYPKWENFKDGDEFSKCSEKLSFNQDDLQNNNNIDINYYLKKKDQSNTVIWGSFHRTLVLASEEPAFKKDILVEWPVEFHINDVEGGYSFMGFLNLFKLLYPGETNVRLAVPLQWLNPVLMMERCGCDPLLTPHDKMPISTAPHLNSPSPGKKGTPPTASLILDITQLPTGSDEAGAFLILDIQLARPLVKVNIPPFISKREINEMLSRKEKGDKKKAADVTPRCTGRGQLNKEWHNTVKMAAYSLRKMPYFGTTEFCAFSRQLSEMRMRVELSTTFWQDAAVYVNNNFVVQDFVESDDTFEELIMNAHTCLMREATTVLLGDQEEEQNLTLRAARHARHLQDIPHATELYLQLVAENENNANSWRELATCLMDDDTDFAQVCIDKAVLLDPRHPLTLLSKGCMLYEKDPDAAEMFFMAMLALYPLWTTGWVVVEAFYIERQEFIVAGEIRKFAKHNQSTGVTEDLAPERGWQNELGDWWYPTPLLPGMCLFFDAADLLLRLRGLSLAEACLGRALSDHGAAPAHTHLVALACRLRGDFSNALCHLQNAIEIFGDVNYLRSLEAECLDKLNDRNGAVASFEKSGNCVNAYSILSLLPCPDAPRTRGVVLEVLRRQPSAYAWMALADDWLMRQAARDKPAGAGDADGEVVMSACAAACAEQALKWDRRCARAWALLAFYAEPKSRREYCKRMAIAVGYNWSDELEMNQNRSRSDYSACFRLGKALKDCECKTYPEWNILKTELADCECKKIEI